jgi:NAD(P)-dependent dehydrogenase (short-subunit alcohol dehydrogenase family)
VECNLISHESVSSTIGRVVEQGLSFDILVNCGGITHRGAPEEFPDDQWNDVSYLSSLILMTDTTSQSHGTIPAFKRFRKASFVSENAGKNHQYRLVNVLSRYYL